MGNRGTAPRILLTLGLDEWSALRHGRFIPVERATGTLCNDVGQASEPVWTIWNKSNLLPSPGFQPRFLDHPGCTKDPIKWLPGNFIQGVKRLESETDYCRD
jgi:hypothetical protein